ncbi:NAD-dependent epimerase/dehydratase family protein [Paenibacillus sp. BC26]|uniref:NAD-dependent epimerase/dehydratase family protein n=1 Tax=Paenibacillus sp. BC26 TaxID=1881032 RepID=UPI0008E1902A|nr:NAD-dependent epimerase/dehydratase family protein [Paenibacillus sp. BC26]SFT29321.1 UDP-glucose 4-epimerase [Paenibacillus sp. BC26]
MKVVVTGGAGFIGSHLVKGLIERGADVHVIDNLSTGSMERVDPRAILHIEDVRFGRAKRIIASVKPDVVYHLAAQADVQRSIAHPNRDASINVGGTINMLEACIMAGVRKMIFASTSGVYGNLERERITEQDPTDPISFYAMSKLTAERYIRLYSRFYGLGYTILRYGNVYGPGQTAKGEGGVIANFIERTVKGLPLMINGEGLQTRDFIYVDDVVSANMAAAALGNNETLHVSTGLRTSISHLAELLRELHPNEIEVLYRPVKPGDIMHSCLSCERTRHTLQWEPVTGIERGVGETYRYWTES